MFLTLHGSLGLVESTLRYWVSRAEIDAGKGPPGALSKGPPGALNTSEREELAKLRKENKRLQMERDILKAAATFFAKESE
jgi:transposase-like protein